MINLLRWLFPDRRTDEQKRIDAIRKLVEEEEKQQAKRKRHTRSTVMPDRRHSLTVIRNHEQF